MAGYYFLENLVKVSRGANQESIQSSTTPDQGYQWESDKLTELREKYYTTLMKSQPVKYMGLHEI